MALPEALVNILVKLGFRGPGEPSRRELRAAIRDRVVEGKRLVAAIPPKSGRPVVQGAH
jgi:hypothetical protein